MDLFPTLSVHQPWASAILSGKKPVENRSWPPPKSLMVNGSFRMLVHASKKKAKIDANTLDDLRRLWPEILEAHPAGAILGSVEVYGHTLMPSPSRQNCPWSFGPVCWLLRNPMACKPVPLPGRQRVFYVGRSALSPELLSHFETIGEACHA